MKGTPKRPETSRVSVKKPAGGYVFIKAEHLQRAWWAYKEELIDLYAFKTWLACHELVARRCCMDRKLKACYRFDELPSLLRSGTVPRVRAAIRSLTKAGLIRWEENAIHLEPKPNGDALNDEFLRMRELVQNWRRKIPVPRKVIKSLATERRKVMIATMLAHLFRCVYYRDNACLSGGRCKASWIADLFGVDVRNVKAARKELIEAEWLTIVPSSQTALNRWGLAVIVDLDHDFRAVAMAKQSPPPRKLSTTQSPPPIRNRKLSSRYNNQKLAHSRADGVQEQLRRKASPSLRRITLADLKEPIRLDRLFWEAVQAGLVSQTQAERLRWFAAAERALELGTRSPCGFFATMVRLGLWDHISNAQEDIARLKLKELDYGERQPGDCVQDAA